MTGRYAAEWLNGIRPAVQIRTKAGFNVRYVNPARINPQRENRVYLRSLTVKNDAILELKLGGTVIRSLKKGHVQPSEMISVNLRPDDFHGLDNGCDSVLEFGIV